jgi:hypothetical protein
MTKIIVKEILGITADPLMLIGDVDKMIITFEEKGETKKSVIPWRMFENENQFKKVLKEAVKNVKKPKQVINMTNEWKGEYNI